MLPRLLVEQSKRNTHTAKKCAYMYRLVELKAAKTHTQIYKINRHEFYCVVDLPLSDYELYGKQLAASRA